MEVKTPCENLLKWSLPGNSLIIVISVMCDFTQQFVFIQPPNYLMNQVSEHLAKFKNILMEEKEGECRFRNQNEEKQKQHLNDKN